MGCSLRHAARLALNAITKEGSRTGSGRRTGCVNRMWWCCCFTGRSAVKARSSRTKRQNGHDGSLPSRPEQEGFNTGHFQLGIFEVSKNLQNFRVKRCAGTASKADDCQNACVNKHCLTPLRLRTSRAKDVFLRRSRLPGESVGRVRSA